MWQVASVFSVETLEPSFDAPITNVTAVAGDTVTLPCSIKDLKDYKVSNNSHLTMLNQRPQGKQLQSPYNAQSKTTRKATTVTLQCSIKDHKVSNNSHLTMLNQRPQGEQQQSPYNAQSKTTRTLKICLYLHPQSMHVWQSLIDFAPRTWTKYGMRGQCISR